MTSYLAFEMQTLNETATLIERQSTPAHYALAGEQVARRFVEIQSREKDPSNKKSLSHAFASVVCKMADNIDSVKDKEFVRARTKTVSLMLETLAAVKAGDDVMLPLRESFTAKASQMMKDAPVQGSAEELAMRLLILNSGAVKTSNPAEAQYEFARKYGC